MRHLLPLVLITVSLVSMCTGMPDFLNIFSGNSKVNTTELGPDILVIQNVNVMPASTINSGDKFSVSFEIKNQDDTNDVKMGYELYDFGLCKPTSTGEGDALTDTQSKFGVPIVLDPLQSDFKDWQFSSPTSDLTGGLSTACPIRWVVGYMFDAKSQIDVDVISADRLYESQKAGQSVAFTPSQVVGRGPIKVYLSFGTSLPVRNDSILPLFITVQDKGEGILRLIGPKNLTINMPPDFNYNTADSSSTLGNICGDRFDCTGSVGTGITCTNTVDIPMIDKSSAQMRCELLTPSSGKIGDLEKTYFISADLNYTYELTGETSVAINPTST